MNPALLGLTGLVNQTAHAAATLAMKFAALSTGFGRALLTIFLKFFANALHPGQNLVVFSVSVFIVSSSYMLISEGPLLADGTRGFNLETIDYLLCILISLFSGAFQIFLSYACRYETKTSNIAIIMQSQTVFSFVFDYLLFKNSILMVNVLGAIIVAVCGVMIVVSKE
jgi:drug/metabolite transporter (DMT)-like permease